MKFEVTKKQILKAIKTEPLKAGKYIHYSEYSYYLGRNIEEPKYDSSKTNCAVCAVGAILDCSLGDKMNPDELDNMGFKLVPFPVFDELTYLSEDIEILDSSRHSIRKLTGVAEKAVNLGHPLSALSSLFEGLMGRRDMVTMEGLANYRARRILSNFVNKNFPSKLTIDTKKEY